MSLGSLEGKNSFEGILSELWLSESLSLDWELHVICPLDVILGSSVMVEVLGGWSVLSFEPGVLPGLWDVLVLGFSESVVVVEELVGGSDVHAGIWVLMLQVLWDVSQVFEVVWSDFGDVHVNHNLVPGVDLIQLVLGESTGIHQVLDVDMLVGENNREVSMLVTWGLWVHNLQVLGFLVRVDVEEKARFVSNASITRKGQSVFLLLRDFLFKVQSLKFLVKKSLDSLLKQFNFFMVTFIDLNRITNLVSRI
jgi:hypothetical protein